MKNCLLLSVCTIIVLVTFFAFKNPHQNVKWQYCTLVGSANLIGTKVKINVDYGQEGGMAHSKANKLKDEEGNVIKFNSMVDALNYMNQQGWEYVAAYPVSTGGQNVYHYLLRKPIE